MNSDKWFIKLGTRVMGPFDSRQLKQMASDNKVTTGSIIANSPNGPWHAASRVKNLFHQKIQETKGLTVAPPTSSVAFPPKAEPIMAKRDDQLSLNDHNNQIMQHSQAASSISRFCADGQDPAMVAKLYERVSEICTSNEGILYMAIQQRPIANFAPDCVVLTSRRFIIFRQKMLGRMTFVDCLWKHCGDVHMEENIIGATVHFIGSNGHQESVDYLPRSQARMIYRVAQEAEERAEVVRRDMKLEEISAGANKTVLNQAIGVPPPTQQASVGQDLVARLTQLKQLLDAGVITAEEFALKKAEMLNHL